MDIDTPPWLVHRRGTRRNVLLLCDHAGNQIPAELQQLGLDDDQRRRHIAWDPGALAVAQALSYVLDAELLGWRVSRLVADPNRAPDHADLILARSDDSFVPGNESLTEAERLRRLRDYHQPYHTAIESAVVARLASGETPLLVAIHSFEPVLVGVARPWRIGVLWKLSREPVAGVINALIEDGGPVGDNQPYDGRVALGYTLERHAISRGLPHILLEIRNDLIPDQHAAEAWAARIASALQRGEMLR
ncbi:N-formylglutamate amidohydrolase [Pseudomarimonas arenosa]|uniref:N-formylglutamate amidohydrolase n=1 Tax=Pseudomarimonas arenosa TaxID=2774145 RepID=A0AAW3ZRN4_9GAMM|nr:N-formylglutamate amidohydrolase [Pseudomarimonas arenosa]MBD8528124.1 N-formylglutamate amidohydrolase [Pseudomarimonas arenosa]